MRYAHTVEQVRAAEAALMATVPEGTLMQRASAGLAYAIGDFLGSVYGRRVLLLVGSGDNGGDALYAGALLARRGAAVDAIVLGDRAHADGLEAFTDAGGRIVTRPRDPEVVVDGIVGIGGKPGLANKASVLVDSLSEVPFVAVDLPSGVSVDDGTLEGPHVRAAVTVTFGTHKVAHLVEPAASASGAVHLVEIGLDLPPAQVSALQAADVAALLPSPDEGAHKYTRGVVGVRAGSDVYPGAAVLAVAGASSGLAGMVRYVGDAEAHVKAAHPEVIGDGKAQAWVVGPGGGSLKEAVAQGVPVVVDASALSDVKGPLGVPTVLTPHAGELASLLGVSRGEVEAEQLRFVKLAADRLDAVVLLKGHHTLIGRPLGDVRVNTVGPAWLATAGSGDVLAGLIGSLLACGLSPYDAASAGAFVHGSAGSLALEDGPFTAGDIARAIPRVLSALLAGGQ